MPERVTEWFGAADSRFRRRTMEKGGGERSWGRSGEVNREKSPRPREGGERVGRSGRPGDAQAGRGGGAPSTLPCSEAHPENQANSAPKRVFI